MTGFNELKTIKGASDNTTYVVLAENEDIMVAVKPEAGMVYFDEMRRFFQIGYRIHVRPQPGKSLPKKETLEKVLGLGHLAIRKGGDRYVGQCRIPACNLTLSPWVVQDHIAQEHLIERLVDGLFERLVGSGLNIIVDKDMIIELSKERFLDMIPDNKVALPEQKVYFGTESYYPPESEGPPKVKTDGEPDPGLQGDC